MKKLWRRLVQANKLDKYGFPDRCIIIDVSLRKDYEKAHLNEAINIPLNIFTEMTRVISKYNNPIVIVSNSNHTSELAVNYITRLGIKVFNGGDWTKLKNTPKDYEGSFQI
jgi:rhodanese-related sulfurtransferase